MRRRASHLAIFILLFGMSLAIPLMIEAIFPGGSAGASSTLPPETPLSLASFRPSGWEAGRVQENYAWVRGDGGSVLGAGDGAEDETADAEAAENADEADEAAAEAPLDLRPGVFAEYTRSWDTLEIRREKYTLGGFVYLSSHTRVLGAGSRLFFRDDTDKISGNSVRAEGAHRLGGGWLLEEGLERDDYDGLHDSVNGDARLSGPIGPKLGVSIEGGRSDVWERLANIRDKLRLWQVGLSLFYELLPRWWLAAFGNAGWYSDHNKRLVTGVEAGHMISPRLGFSAAVGAETTRASDQALTYWSPAYYHYLYGRLRLSREYERQPFEPRPVDADGWRRRLGYLAEVTAGANNDGHLEISERAGLRLRATDALTLRAEFFHLDSDGRFDENTYSENRLEAGAEVRF